MASTLAALEALPAEVRDGARLVFVTHSVPTTMDEGSGPDGHAYTAQHRDVARLVTAGVAAATGTDRELDLVYCSRSGPPTQPWLEPDVNDHLEALVADGVPAAVLVPIGFVSDHMEVRFDLDTEALATARRVGLPVDPGGHGGHRPEVRRGGARAGARAGRRRPGRGAGTPVARRAGCEPRRVPRRLLPQRPRPAAAGSVRRGVTVRPARAARAGRGDGPGGRPADRRGAPPGPRGRDHQDLGHRHRDRDGPAGRAAAGRPDHGRPPRRRHPR